MKQKLLSRILFLLITLIAGSTSSWADEVTYDFTKIDGFSSWSTSYAEHSVEYDEATVTFTSANRQTSTITNQPVTKGQPVSLVMKGTKTISAVSFTCTQWGTKAQTITLHYSTDSGENYTSTEVTSTNFTISSNNLPSGTNAVKITFSSTSNQVGIASATITYADGGDTPPVEKEECDLALTGAPIALTFDMYNNSEAQYISYTTSSTGEITAESNDAVSCYADPEKKTISVTPFASTNGEPLVITLNQAADENYKAGSVTFTVTVTDATPITTHKAVFSVNGATTEQEFAEGAAIEFPATPDNIYGKAFVGWTHFPISGTTDVAPTIYTSATMGDSDVFFYAVYANASGEISNKSVTINSGTTGLPTSYGTANTFTEYTLGGEKFQIQQVYLNGEKLQWRAAGNSNGTGTMYNSESFGKITSIVLTYNSSDSNKNFTLKVGNSANPTGGTEVTPSINGSTYTFDCSSLNSGFFVLTNGSGAGYLDEIVINYAVGSATYSDYCTTVEKVATFSYVDYQGKGEKDYGASYTMIQTDVRISHNKFYGSDTYPNAYFYGYGDAGEGVITITPTGGATITKIEITTTDTEHNGYQVVDEKAGEIIPSVGEVTANNEDKTKATVTTWTGSASEQFTITNTRTIVWSSIKVYYIGGLPKCATPAISGETPFVTYSTVTISCDTEGATIQYSTSTDGVNYTAYQTYTGPFQVSQTTQVKAQATKEGMVPSDEAYKLFTQQGAIPNIGYFISSHANNPFTDPEYLLLEDALVTFKNGTTAYIKDAYRAVMLYNCAGDLEAGDKINGYMHVTGYKVYNGLPEITGFELVEGYSKTSGNEVTPTVMTLAELLGGAESSPYEMYLSEYVKIENATVTSAFASKSCTIAQGDYSIILRDQNSTATLTSTAGDVITVTGHIAIYNTTKQIAVYGQDQIVAGEAPAQISISPDTYSMDAKAGGGELPVVCTNLATDPQLVVVFVKQDGVTPQSYDWITAVINDKGNINGQILENTGEARTAYFYVQGVDANNNVVKSNLVTFTQEAPVTEPTITVNTETWEFEYTGGAKTFGFEYDNLGSDPTFNVQFFESDGKTETACGWITTEFVANDNKVTITAAANDETSARTAYFKIYAEVNKTKVYSNLVTISQKFNSDTPQISGDQFVKVNSTEELTEGEYLVVYEEAGLAFDGGLEKLDVAKNTITVTIADGAIAKTEANSAASFTISAAEGGYTIQGANGKYIGMASDGNGLSESEKEVYTNTISFETNGDANIVGSGGAYLRYNATSGQERFRYYKSSSYTNQKAIALYKLVEEPDTRLNPELSFSTDVVNAAIGDELVLPTLSAAEGFNGTVEYKSSDETVAQIVDSETGELILVGEGQTTITANFAGNDTYKAGAASYTLNVTDNRIATTIIQDNIELNLDDVATLTRLAPVVKDADSNVIEYTNDPKGDGLPEVYFEIVSDEKGILGSLDSHGNIILNSIVGTATIKAVYNQFQLNENYKPSECTFTITVVDPSNVPTYYALVAEYGGKFFAVNSSFNSEKNKYGATEVDAVNGKVVSKQTDAISWELILPTSSDKSYYIKSKKTNKYIGNTSSASLTQQSATSDSQSKWGFDSDNNSWVNHTNRYIIYNGDVNGFKNYASSNVNKTGYSDYTTAYTFVDGYVRDLTRKEGGVVEWGTICLTNTVAADDYSGVTFYSIKGKTVDTNGNPTSLVLEEETGELTAGVAYIFQTNEGATKLIAAYSDETIDEPFSAADNKGLEGSFTGTAVKAGMYLLSGGKIVQCGEDCSIGPNRAFINMDEVHVVTESESGVKLFIGGEDGISSLDAAAEGAVIYDLSGRRVSKTTKGLYIVNGKKVAVK